MVDGVSLLAVAVVVVVVTVDEDTAVVARSGGFHAKLSSGVTAGDTLFILLLSGCSLLGSGLTGLYSLLSVSWVQDSGLVCTVSGAAVTASRSRRLASACSNNSSSLRDAGDGEGSVHDPCFGLRSVAP